MGEDKKNPFFPLSHPLPPPPRPPLPTGKHAPSSFVSVLFFLPSSSAHPRFFGSQRDHVTKKTLFYFPIFYIFFLLFPGWSPSVERTHTHAACRAEQHPCVSPHRCSLDTLGKKFSVDSQHLKTIAAQFFHAHWILFSTSEIWMNVARSTDNSSNNNTNRWVNLFLFIYCLRK